MHDVDVRRQCTTGQLLLTHLTRALEHTGSSEGTLGLSARSGGEAGRKACSATQHRETHQHGLEMITLPIITHLLTTSCSTHIEPKWRPTQSLGVVPNLWTGPKVIALRRSCLPLRARTASQACPLTGTQMVEVHLPVHHKHVAGQDDAARAGKHAHAGRVDFVGLQG